MTVFINGDGEKQKEKKEYKGKISYYFKKNIILSQKKEMWEKRKYLIR